MKEDSFHKCQGFETIRIQLAEDHEVVRTGFRYMLESENVMDVVAESATGEQTCRDYDLHKPDVLVMGLSLPDINGLNVMRHILSRNTEARILILSKNSSELVKETALHLGARGFVSKQCDERSLVTAICRVMQGDRYVDPVSAAQLTWKKGEFSDASLASLTLREMEVCRLLAKGQSVSGIAEQMQLSDKTIYTHWEHIRQKLGVKSAASLSRIAFLFDFYTHDQNIS